MDGARARAIDGVTVTMTLRRRNARWCRNGDGRPVVFDDIEMEEGHHHHLENAYFRKHAKYRIIH